MRRGSICRWRLWIGIVLLAVCTAAQAGTIWYVDTNATGGNNGQTWENAFTDLQAALAAALPGDQVWVAGGYGPEWPGPAGHILSSAEAYDPATDQWTFVASMTVARNSVAVTADATRRIYAVGGKAEEVNK